MATAAALLSWASGRPYSPRQPGRAAVVARHVARITHTRDVDAALAIMRRSRQPEVVAVADRWAAALADYMPEGWR